MSGFEGTAAIGGLSFVFEVKISGRLCCGARVGAPHGFGCAQGVIGGLPLSHRRCAVAIRYLSKASLSIRSPRGPTIRTAVKCGGKSYARSSASRLELCSETNSTGGETVESRMKSFRLFGGRPFVIVPSPKFKPKVVNDITPQHRT
jgi:hypothetical protein